MTELKGLYLQVKEDNFILHLKLIILRETLWLSCAKLIFKQPVSFYLSSREGLY